MIRKYISSALALFAASILFFSCKKDYNCHCDLNIYNPQINETVNQHHIKKVYGTERGVKAECQAEQYRLDTSSYIYALCAIY